MKHSRLIQILAAVALSLLFIGCTGVGIYATVAVTPKLQTGNLPDGLSATPVVALGDYAFFSSGPGIWVRRVKPHAASKWTSISMPVRSGSNSWDGVQSIAATDSRIYFALYDYDSGNSNYAVGLSYIDQYDSSTLNLKELKVWTSNPSGYQTLNLFAPGNDRVFVNISEYNGPYKPINSNDKKENFTFSELFILNDTETAWTADTKIASASLNDPTDGRYVTGVADNGAGKVLISATASRASADKGVLLHWDGKLAEPVEVQEVTELPALNAVTWLPNVRDGKGAFIVAATASSGKTYPIYVSIDGSEWYTVGRTTTDVLVTGFIDISNTPAARTDDARIVLVATRSYIDGTKSRKPLGYFELDTASELKADNSWSLNTSWKSFKFAKINEYGASKLKSSSITGMTLVGDDLYAATRGKGVWKVQNINGPDESPKWEQE